MMDSYGQNGEDVILARTFWDVPVGFYIDVGAWHAEIHSVTKALYDRGWSGINVEPQPAALNQLQIARDRDLNLGFAISDRPGTLDLIVPTDTGLATLEPGVIRDDVEGYADQNVISVESMTLEALIDTFAPDQSISILKIDVEGHEAGVLRSANFRRHRPIVVMVEATLPTTMTPAWMEWEWMLTSAGYSFAQFDGLNRFYLREDRSDLMPRISVPTNIFDQYTTPESRALREKISALEAEVEQLKSANTPSPARDD